MIRGYPPVLGAMLLVDGVITLILGGDAAVSLGELVAYLLLPPLAMFLVTRTTGGRRLNAVTLGVTIAGAAVLLAALFLLGGVHLVTLPPWVLVLVGAVFLGVALFVMRLSAPASEDREGPSLLSPSERAGFTGHDPEGDDPRPSYDEYGIPTSRDDFGASARDDFGASRRDEFGSPPGDYDRPAEPEWPPSRRDDPAPSTYPTSHSADETVHGPSRVPSHSAGPPQPEWPPRREPIGAPWSAESRTEPEPAATWSDNDSGNTAGAQPNWSAGPADREWPPAPAGAEWPPRRDPEPAESPAPLPAQSQAPPPAQSQAQEQRSWFEAEEAQPTESSWSAGPPDGEWPPSERTYQSGRRSRHPDQ